MIVRFRWILCIAPIVQRPSMLPFQGSDPSSNLGGGVKGFCDFDGTLFYFYVIKSPFYLLKQGDFLEDEN